MAVLLLAGLAVILDGANYNGHYIAAMDYSVFAHHSAVTCDPETVVYTLRAGHEGFKILHAYPGIAHETAQRGGTLITLEGRGGYVIEQVKSGRG